MGRREEAWVVELLAGCLRAREVLVQQDGGEDWEVLRGGGGAPDPHPWQRLLRATGRQRGG